MEKMKVMRDDAGREVVHFVTPSGVQAWISTGISDAALEKFARSLRRKLKAHGLGPGHGPDSVPRPAPTGKQRRRPAAAVQQSRQETK
jgi:hypothetical protein